MNPADELRDIKEQMLELLEAARQIVRGTGEEDRAKAYWYAQICCALDDDHMFLGGGTVTMQDTINALDPANADSDEEIDQ